MKEFQAALCASSGYAVAPVFLAEHTEVAADKRTIAEEEAEAEIARFDAAVAKARADLLALSKTDGIFAGHYALAGDIALREGVTKRIRDERMNAEAALVATVDQYTALCASAEDAYLRERAADMQDVCERLLRALSGVGDEAFCEITEHCILVAKELTPSDMAKIDLTLVDGVITEQGGVTSHAAIIAANHGIPFLTGAGPLLDEVRNGQIAVIDAAAGSFCLDPDQETIAAYREKAAEYQKRQKEMERFGTLPSKTKDGHSFRICANIGGPDELKSAPGASIEGVGLFRSESLYMKSDHFPTEDEQFAAYKEAAELLEGKELTIRTLDIGGDKSLSYASFPKEDNPFLGWRAIRMSLDQPEIFKTQLRAILRASAFGSVRILYPMMISLDELHAANALLDECRAALRDEGLKFDERLKIGVMVETPAAVFMADEFAAEADFISIGSNDLTQYLTAADRGNEKISPYCNPFNPAVLRAIGYTVKAAHSRGIEVGICGELAADRKAAPLLLGLGLDEFSVSAAGAAALKYQLRGCSYEEMKAKAAEVLRQDSVEAVMKILNGDEER